VSCYKFEDYLKEKIDLDELKIHIKSCDKCKRAFRLDNQILKGSRSLNDKLVVPDLWSVIEEKIETDKPFIIKFKRNKRLLFAAAATFLIVTTIWLFNITFDQKPSIRILSDQTLQKVIQAESSYIEAIDELESLAYAELEDTTEPLAQLYRNRLSLIDHQIQNCKKALETNPANSHIRRYLMAALQDKRKTLEEILKADG
jgi:hypothetical protein